VADRLVGTLSATCDKTRVVPGSPESSFLFEKITSATPACGDRMPIGTELSAAEKGCIEQWIASLPPSDGGAGDGGCETCGGSGCVDLQTDAAHCGSCDKACPPGSTCAGGACACGPTLTDCGGACVDTQSDPKHCNGCGDACPGGEVCNLGACSASCGTLTNCNGACVDTQTSATNCGSCGNTCGQGTTCQAGKCACPGGGEVCGGTCVDTQNDPSNCGSCGNTCAAGQTCSSGACACGSASVSFAAAVQPIFTAKCATNGCHAGAKPQEGLNLTVGKAHAGLVGVTADQCNDGRKRVQPGQPTESYLVDKIMNVDLCFGTRMPKLSSLPQGDVETIVNWICEGAPDN
jgi:hypothetical protein